MRVLVDGLPLLGTASIGSYLNDLVTHLVASGRHQYEIFFRSFRRETRQRISRWRANGHWPEVTLRTSRIPDRVLEWFWTRRSIYLPGTELWLGRPDVFLSTIYFTPLLRKSATILIAYDLIPLRFPELYGRDQPLLPERLRRGVERAQALIAISEATKRDFVDYLGADPERIHVVYPGADPRFRPETDRAATDRVLSRYGIRRPYLLYVGVLAPHKNVDGLIRVFRRLKQEHRLAHRLVLVGRNTAGRGLLEDAQDLFDSGDCIYLDYVPDPDLPAVYHGADALALLSLHEGFGLPVLEAMACGVPVVASRAGALPEVVGGAGLLVPPREDPAIEAVLLEVLTRPGLRAELGARGLQRAAGFDWPSSSLRFQRVLEKTWEETREKESSP